MVQFGLLVPTHDTHMLPSLPHDELELPSTQVVTLQQPPRQGWVASQAVVHFLASEQESCRLQPEEVTTLKELPADGLTKTRVSQAGNDLLVAIARQDWKWSPELFRFDPSGKFVQKYGAAEGKGELHGELTGCGDGLCASAYMNQLEIYDRDGMRVGGASLTTLTKLNGVYIGGIVDVPDKGVYVLIGHQPTPKGDGRAEVVRIDGVY